MTDADDIKPREDSAGTAVNPDDCLHCFCQDTGGNLKCCKCGSILLVKEADEYGCFREVKPSLPGSGSL